MGGKSPAGTGPRVSCIFPCSLCVCRHNNYSKSSYFIQANNRSPVRVIATSSNAVSGRFRSRLTLCGLLVNMSITTNCFCQTLEETVRESASAWQERDARFRFVGGRASRGDELIICDIGRGYRRLTSAGSLCSETGP